MCSVDGGEIVAACLHVLAALEHDRFIAQFDQAECGKHSGGTGTDDDDRLFAMYRRVVLGAPRPQAGAFDDVVLQSDDYVTTARIHRALERHDDPTTITRQGKFFIQRRNEQGFVEGFGRRQD